MKKSLQSVLLSIFLALFGIPTSLAQVDPNIEWKLIRLAHFDLIYDAKHQDLANAYAFHLEDIVKTLNTVFSEIPEKTLVVLNDRTDLTNGYATAIPQPTIVAFPVMPGPLESIYEHSDWAHELMLHEYTHILSFEPRRGVMKVLHSVFGSIITPTVLLPRWWLEGVAVEMETRLTAFGRLRSSGQDAALRSYIVDGTVDQISLSEINEVTIPSWPGGARPYLFGSLMWSQMVTMKTPAVIEELHQRYGGRLPFLINGPVEDIFGDYYSGIFEKMIEDLKIRVGAQLKTLQQLAPSQALEFPIKTVEAFSAGISPDGLKMAYLSKDETTRRSVKVLQRHSLDVRFTGADTIGGVSQDITEQSDALSPLPRKLEDHDDGPPAGTISRISWFGDSKKFIFDRVVEHSRYNERSDLWIFDLETKKSKQLTKRLRAREPSMDRNDQRAVFVKLTAGNTSLAVFDLATNSAEDIYVPPLLTTVSFPVFWTDHEVIFGQRTREGHEGLHLINLNTRQVTPILTDYPKARLAQRTPLGLIFTSTQNGVPNLYLAQADLKKAEPLTHTLTGVGISSLDPHSHDLYITQITSKGPRIGILPKDEWVRLRGKTLPAVKPLFADRYPQDAARPENTSAATYEAEDYSPYGYLWPRFWLPGFFANQNGYYIAATTSQADPVGLHAYSLTAAYDSYLKEGSYSVFYVNNTTDAIIGLGAVDYRTYLVNTDYQVHFQMQQATARWQFPELSSDLYGKLGWNWAQRDIFDTHINQTGPSIGLQYSAFSQSGEQISPEVGYGAEINQTSYLRNALHEGFNETRFSFINYFSKWLPKRHVLMARVHGRFIEDDNYESTLAYPLFGNSILPQYLMRGYPTGAFLFKTMANYTVEYRFPLRRIYRGSQTLPLFIRRLHGAVVADGIQLDGYAYREDLGGPAGFNRFEAVPKWKIFWNAGLELKVDVTLGYHFPLTFYGGYYWALDTTYAGPANPQFSVGLLL